jgi:DNA-binding Lrp family transcriptional regulator
MPLTLMDGGAAMSKVYVLVQTAVGKNRDVAMALKAVPGLVSVDIVTGPYDIIAVMNAKSLAEVGELITEQVHPIPGITRTVTCLVV